MSLATQFAPCVPLPQPGQSPAGSPRVGGNRHLHAVPAAGRPAGRAVEGAQLDRDRAPQLSPVALLRAPARVSPVAPVRLTRRGVLALSLLVAALGVALVWVAALSAGSATGGATEAGGYQGPATVTVRAGDTLWSIAGRVAPARDSRAEVAALQRLNHLRGVQLVPGQRLAVR